MSDLKPRGTVVGLGAAACAVCCAPPLMALLGIAGAGLVATLFTALLAGLSFAVVVATATAVAVMVRHRRGQREATPPGPVTVEVGPTRLE
jgi:xanthosine utilization system XapX-like protein